MSEKQIKVDNSFITIEQVCAVARRKQQIALSDDESFKYLIEKGAGFLDRLLEKDGAIYGVTTGYGDSCTVKVPLDLVNELPIHLYTFHGCGLGDFFDEETGRAVLVSRLASLTKGYSGVSYNLLKQLVTLLEKEMTPIIPQEGSVGASGDLTPLSYVAAVLCGKRKVYYKGEERGTAEVFSQEGVEPIQLRPKEALAIMNGTAVMTAVACLAFKRAEYLSKLAAKITSLATFAVNGNAHHFDEILFDVKPHAGQQRVAAWIREDIRTGEPLRNPDRIQNRYSIRCAPHVIGVLEDTLPWCRTMIENELNSSNDNPIIDGEGEHVMHGGHFYGGHIAMAMDSLKIAVANIADLLDRQMALLMDTKFNNGLPPNLSGAKGSRAAINHGFKAVQIGVSSWTAEALKQTMPASVFSRSTECHNQDKVSMGTISARDCIRVLELTEQVAAAVLMAVSQGVEIRHNLHNEEIELSNNLKQILAYVRDVSASVEEDRELDSDLRNMIDVIRQQSWNLYG
ncbi:MAG: aromatic amino acid lyase [Gammaproteobacteria bacterium]|nr:MAG: aromatic amino acid lyase [Gammaproteobacteria bacterium]